MADCKLLDAVSAGRAAEVAALLQARANPNSTNECGFPVLFRAVRYAHTIVQQLVDAKADVDATLQDGTTALDIAVRMKAGGVVKQLIDAKANVDARNKVGRTPIIEAALARHWEVVKLLIDAKADVDGPFPPLFLSVSNSSVVQQLVEAKASVDAVRWDGQTPLHKACSNGYVDTTRLLLHAKANVNATSQDGSTPLYVSNDAPTVRLLLDAKASLKDALEANPHMPLLHKRTLALDALQELIRAKADVNVVDKHGRRPLETLLAYPDKVKLLVEAKANINATQQDATTPLYLAAWYGHSESVQLLVDAKANLNVARHGGGTPLWIAAASGASGKWDIVRRLVEARADLNAGKKKETPLHVATILVKWDIVQALVKSKADVNRATKRKVTPLHHAARWDNPRGVQLLLAAKARVDLTDTTGCSPLSVAASSGTMESARMLVRAKADVNTVDKLGFNALCHAATKGNTSTLQVLLDAKADVERPVFHSRRSPCPLRLVFSKGHATAVSLLVRAGAPTSSVVPTDEELSQYHTHRDRMRVRACINELNQFALLLATRVDEVFLRVMNFPPDIVDVLLEYVFRPARHHRVVQQLRASTSSKPSSAGSSTGKPGPAV